MDNNNKNRICVIIKEDMMYDARKLFVGDLLVIVNVYPLKVQRNDVYKLYNTEAFTTKLWAGKY